jgi:hypothetical protein
MFMRSERDVCLFIYNFFSISQIWYFHSYVFFLTYAYIHKRGETTLKEFFVSIFEINDLTLHCFFLFPLDLTCIKKSNLNDLHGLSIESFP